MKRSFPTILLLLLFCVSMMVAVTPAFAESTDENAVALPSQAPTLPAQFHGTLYNNEGKPFPAGTVITAEVNGITSTFTLTEDGKIGGSGTFDEKFLISGVNDGDVVTLKIKDTDVVTTFTYDGKTAGNVGELSLTVDAAIPTPTPTDTGGGSGGNGGGAGPSSGGSGSGSSGGIVTPVVAPTATVAEMTPAATATADAAETPAATVTESVAQPAATALPTEAARTPLSVAGMMFGCLAVAWVASRRR